MPQKYRHSNTNISMLNYHIVFCPRFRRKIFLIPRVEELFKNRIAEICKKLDVEIIAMECNEDHVHLFLNCPPTLSPAYIVKELKGATGRYIMTSVPTLSKMQNLWTRSYFVSTAGNVSSETIKKYVEKQKKRSS